MGFKNQTGDAAFDYLQETIPNLLVTSLEQSGRFRVTTWQELKDLLRRSGKEASAAFDDEAGFAICRQAGIEMLAVGFYTKAGDAFVTDVKIFDAATKRALKTTQARGEGPASILKSQIDEISRSIRRGRGLAALKIEKAGPRIADMTTSSLEAYRAYLQGRDEYERYRGADARRSLEKAVALDPEFAIAHLYLSRALGSLNDNKAREEAVGRALQFAAQASEKERLYIEAEYASIVKRDHPERRRILEDLVARYPGEKDAFYELARYYEGNREFSKALDGYEKTLALDPDFSPVLNRLALTYLRSGEPAKAIPYLERYAALNPNDPKPLDSIAQMLLLTGRLDEAAAKYEEVLAAFPDFILSWNGLAYVKALQERYQEALRSLDGLVARAPAASAKATGIWLRAFLFDFLGRRDRSLADFLDLKASSSVRGDEYLLMATEWILVFVRLDRGEYDEAEKSIEAMVLISAKRNSSRPALTETVKAMLQARLEIARGRPETALATLKAAEAIFAGLDPATREDFSYQWMSTKAEATLAAGRVDEAIEAGEKLVIGILPGLVVNGIASYNQPFLKDVLARAYWKKGDLERAAAEYRKLLTIDPASHLRCWMSPLYHYRLGRVLEEKGDRAGARAEYAKFLEGWKDADPSHPELADARRRLAAR